MKITEKVSFFTIFALLNWQELTYLVTLQATGFQKLAKNWLFSVLLKNFYPVRMYDFYDFQTPWCFLFFFFSWKCTNFTTKEGLTKKFESANSFDLKMYSNFIKADINLPDAQLDFFKDCSRHIFKAKATTSIIEQKFFTPYDKIIVDDTLV